MFNFKKTTYIILHILMICVLGFSLLVYTSLSSYSPFYEPCGTQFLAIFIISLPVLLLLGISLIFLNRKYLLSRTNLYLPFYALAGLSLPLVIDGGLHNITTSIGTILCVFFIIQTIISVVTHFKNTNLA